MACSMNRDSTATAPGGSTVRWVIGTGSVARAFPTLAVQQLAVWAVAPSEAYEHLLGPPLTGARLDAHPA